MVTATSVTAAASSIVGHRVQATSLESTSATTTYHRMTIDGVGVFYRQAGPKNAPAIVLLHGGIPMKNGTTGPAAQSTMPSSKDSSTQGASTAGSAEKGGNTTTPGGAIGK